MSRSEWRSFYLTVAPGAHPEGALSLEVVAIDNSVCTVPLPAVTFKSNRSYRREATLRLGDFVAADPFSVSAASTTCKVGEPVVFEMSGMAETVDFYSGEMFHEWIYAKKDRLAYPDIFFSFKAQLQQGTSPRLRGPTSRTTSPCRRRSGPRTTVLRKWAVTRSPDV